MKVLRSLQAKCEDLPVAEDADLDYWIFSRKGFEERLLEAASEDSSIHLVSMEKLLDVR